MDANGHAGDGASVGTAELALARLATFPEDNPNIVIETDLRGNVSYMNPVARALFPDLEELGAQHPLLRPLSEAVPVVVARDGDRFRSQEVVVGSSTFEVKICAAEVVDRTFIRVYASDVTPMREAQRTVHELASRVVRAQEEERRRISRELHDEAGQALTALKIGLSLVRREEALDAATLRENLDEAIALVEDTHERIRNLAHGLRPAALDAVGLGGTLDDLCRGFADRTGLEIGFTAEVLPDLNDDIQICLYRFVQEALTNCAVHADASRVSVTLRVRDHEVVASVDDDGSGTSDDVLEAPRGSGFGLVGIRERVELLAGRLSVRSSPGAGFGLTATIPVRGAS